MWCHAQIRPTGGQQSPYYDQLAQATSIAEGSSLGIFGTVRPHAPTMLCFAILAQHTDNIWLLEAQSFRMHCIAGQLHFGQLCTEAVSSPQAHIWVFMLLSGNLLAC